MRSLESEIYYQKLEKELDRRGIPYCYNAFGLRFSTGLDSWIVDADNLSKGHTLVILYHKSKYKGGQSRIPDYHVQFKKVIQPYRLVGYTVKHAAKYVVPTAVYA